MHHLMMYRHTYGTVSVAHPDFALQIECGAPREAEGLQVGVHLSLVHALVGPGALEAADQLLVHGAPETDPRK